jgi:hypothetical protein
MSTQRKRPPAASTSRLKASTIRAVTTVGSLS